MTNQSNRLAQRLRSGALWTLIGRSAGMGTVFAVHVVLPRGLGADSYAAFVLAWSIATLLSMLGMFGLNTLGCRYLSESFAVNDSGRAIRALTIIGTLAAFAVAISAALGAVLTSRFVPSWFGAPELADVALAVAVWIVLLAVTQLMAELLRGLHNLFAASLLSGVAGGLLSNSIFLILLLVIGAHQELNLSVVVMAVVASLVVQLVVSCVFLWLSWRSTEKQAAPTSQTLSDLSWWRVVRDATPIMSVQVGSFGVAQFDIWLVGLIGGTEQLAIYSVARRLALLIAIPLTQVGQVISSSIAELHARQDRERLASLLKGAATVGALITVPLAVGLLLGGQLLLSRVFGPEYAAGAVALQFFCLGQLAYALTGPCGPALLMTGHQRIVLTTMLMSVSIFALTPLAVSYFGVNGIAALVATFVALNNVMQCVALRARTGLTTTPCFELSFLKSIYSAAARTSRVGIAG